VNRTRLCVAVCLGLGLLGATDVGRAAGQAASTSYQCFGDQATIVGTPGDDLLVGREDTADVIVGLGGDDVIFGAEDVTLATAPGDRLCGGVGADYVRGGTGEDRIQGGGGADDVDGSYNLDWVTQGGPGNDRVADCDSEYSGGARRIEGGSGDDSMCVDIDSTRMLGGAGNDTLVELTCSYDSVLRGGDGNDRVESYFDNLNGANCSDTSVFDSRGSDEVEGGTGTDVALVNRGDRVSEVETVRIR
jgi:Ca2+-binding RTX toxin-like protein